MMSPDTYFKCPYRDMVLTQPFAADRQRDREMFGLRWPHII
jgi:hypothetical protein